ncbi:MAG: class I SAM-dependent methyltransferase [Parvularculaceae bacterium]
MPKLTYRGAALGALALLIGCSQEDAPPAPEGADAEQMPTTDAGAVDAAPTDAAPTDAGDDDADDSAAGTYVMPAEMPAYIRDAVNSPRRPAPDRARDAMRRPGHVIWFAGVEPGDTVADLSPAGGYYSRILGEVVGAEGRVYAIDWDWVVENFGDAVKPFANAVAAGDVPNVDYSVQPNDGFTPPEQVDFVFSILTYHDAHWGEVDVDPALMNISAFGALKPGGIYLIVDHRALPESGSEGVDAYHRIDPELVLEEVRMAGFEWVGESDALSNPEDPLNVGVFGDIRGRTDRFIYKFRKP